MSQVFYRIILIAADTISFISSTFSPPIQRSYKMFRLKLELLLLPDNLHLGNRWDRCKLRSSTGSGDSDNPRSGKRIYHFRATAVGFQDRAPAKTPGNRFQLTPLSRARVEILLCIRIRLKGKKQISLKLAIRII